jgi:hypothetical protein
MFTWFGPANVPTVMQQTGRVCPPIGPHTG